jgi:hypothetical protein
MRTRKLNRRSFAASVLGGVVIGATALVTGRAGAQNVRYSGVTDCDSSDRPGYGTGVRNQVTDSDTGPHADPRCHGRGPQRAPDGPSGYGSGYVETPSNCSDSDGGSTADPGGRGRRCGPGYSAPRSNVPTHTRHCTDSDRGLNADLVQQGVRC